MMTTPLSLPALSAAALALVVPLATRDHLVLKQHPRSALVWPAPESNDAPQPHGLLFLPHFFFTLLVDLRPTAAAAPGYSTSARSGMAAPWEEEHVGDAFAKLYGYYVLDRNDSDERARYEAAARDRCTDTRLCATMALREAAVCEDYAYASLVRATHVAGGLYRLACRHHAVAQVLAERLLVSRSPVHVNLRFGPCLAARLMDPKQGGSAPVLSIPNDVSDAAHTAAALLTAQCGLQRPLHTPVLQPRLFAPLPDLGASPPAAFWVTAKHLPRDYPAARLAPRRAPNVPVQLLAAGTSVVWPRAHVTYYGVLNKHADVVLAFGQRRPLPRSFLAPSPSTAAAAARALPSPGVKRSAAAADLGHSGVLRAKRLRAVASQIDFGTFLQRLRALREPAQVAALYRAEFFEAWVMARACAHAPELAPGVLAALAEAARGTFPTHSRVMQAFVAATTTTRTDVS